MVLEEKAAELYHLSLLERPSSSHRAPPTILGVEKGGKAFQKLHEQLLRQGFRRALPKAGEEWGSAPGYFREDLGTVRFVCPPARAHQKPATRGLPALPDKRAVLLLENPHSVDVPYLGKTFGVLVPQVGRFVLDKGLELRTGRSFNPEQIYESSQNLMILLDLLVGHAEMEEEALNDFLEIRPPALLKEFITQLKQNGPGTVLWDSAQRLYLQRHPGAKIVTLTRWYWEFLPRLARFLEKQKDPAP